MRSSGTLAQAGRRGVASLRALLLAMAALPLLAFAVPSSFSVTDLQGRTHSLTAHRGKWVLVNLWATWCPPCLMEMPELEAVSKSQNDLVVLGIAVDGQSPARVAAFAEKLKVSYPLVAGDDEMAKQFNARGFPTSILYAPTGDVVLVKEGSITRQEIEVALAQYPAPRK